MQLITSNSLFTNIINRDTTCNNGTCREGQLYSYCRQRFRSVDYLMTSACCPRILKADGHGCTQLLEDYVEYRYPSELFSRILSEATTFTWPWWCACRRAHTQTRRLHCYMYVRIEIPSEPPWLHDYIMTPGRDR